MGSSMRYNQLPLPGAVTGQTLNVYFAKKRTQVDKAA